jgi:hypothetical protein
MQSKLAGRRPATDGGGFCDWYSYAASYTTSYSLKQHRPQVMKSIASQISDVWCNPKKKPWEERAKDRLSV